MKTGQTNPAVAEYLEALRLRPDFSPAHYNLANALAAQGQFDQAQQHYRASLTSLDNRTSAAADAHNNLAYLLVRSGNLDEAAVHFKSAIGTQPRLWQAHYGLGDVLARQDKLEQAADEFSSVIRIKPDQPSGHFQLGIVLDRSGKVREAIQEYQSTLQLNPAHVDGLNRLAWILATNPDATLRDGPKAVELAEHACKLTNFQRPILLLTLAAAYAEAGQFAEAVNAAQRANAALQVANQNELLRKSQVLLDEFRSGKPHREAGVRR
jgi:tetratricopeptide (TPR) repeat protein